jgi:type VI secretion system protein ImpH
MAGTDGNKTEALSLLEEMRREPYRFGFFSAVRRVNCGFPEMALTGAAYHPVDDPVRFGQTPYTSFAPSTLSSLEFDAANDVPRLSQNFLGLFGPNGPMPVHLTEFARDRLRHHHDATIAHFADMFPGEDRFSVYVGALAGLGTQAFRDADAMPHNAKLHFAGHLSSLPRHAEGLASLLEGFLRVPVKIVEFVAHWLTIPRRDRFVLGSQGSLGRLGESAVLGERVWQRQDKFQVRLGPMSLEEYESFLPTGTAYKALVAAVRNYLGLELLWEARLQLKGTEKPVTCLGKQGALGWTSWLQTEKPSGVVADLVLQTANYQI